MRGNLRHRAPRACKWARKTLLETAALLEKGAGGRVGPSPVWCNWQCKCNANTMQIQCKYNGLWGFSSPLAPQGQHLSLLGLLPVPLDSLDTWEPLSVLSPPKFSTKLLFMLPEIPDTGEFPPCWDHYPSHLSSICSQWIISLFLWCSFWFF